MLCVLTSFNSFVLSLVIDLHCKTPLNRALLKSPKIIHPSVSFSLASSSPVSNGTTSFDCSRVDSCDSIELMTECHVQMPLLLQILVFYSSMRLAPESTDMWALEIGFKSIELWHDKVALRPSTLYFSDHQMKKSLRKLVAKLRRNTIEEKRESHPLFRQMETRNFIGYPSRQRERRINSLPT